MNKEIINPIIAVVNALNNVEVRGKSNLANLSGSIAILEDLLTALNKEPNQTEEVS